MSTQLTVQALADEMLDLIAAEDPLDDALEGYPGVADRLGDPSAAADERLAASASRLAARARELATPDGGPGRSDDLTLALVVQQAESVTVRRRAGLIGFTVADYQTSPLGRLLGALPEVRPVGPEQVRGFLQRLAHIPAYLASAAQRHRASVAAGLTPVASRVRSAVSRIDAYLAEPDADPLRRPPLDGRAADERDRLLAEVVRPAFAAYRDVLAHEIAPHGRPDDRPGLCWLPGGTRIYEDLCRMHTTTGYSPAELHRLGGQVAARLDAEYEAIGGPLLGVDRAAEVRHRLRTDPSLRWESGAGLLDAIRSAVRRAQQAAPDWFGTLPAEPCQIKPAPDPGAPLAYYLPAALDGSRPGEVYVNVHNATASNRCLAEALAYHEAVPGHHVQLTLARGLTGVPHLRRLAWINALIEGWGLYAERLADEMGLYSGQLDRLGMVVMDSLRAARLVVDTGLHALGWSREAAVEYLRATTVLAEAEIQREVDRYIDMPGQALSYLVGRLELERLRAEAQQRLADRFDVRAFHDTVLGCGSLPLDLLAHVVDAWCASGTPGRRDGEVRSPLARTDAT